MNHINRRLTVAGGAALVLLLGLALALAHSGAHAQGVHHPVADQGPAPQVVPPSTVPTYTVSQADAHLSYRIVTPTPSVLPGPATAFVHLHGAGSSAAASVTFDGPNDAWAVNIYEAPGPTYSDQVPNARHITLDGRATQVASWTGGTTPLAEAYFEVGPNMWFDVTGFHVPLAKVEAILVNLASQYPS